MPNRDIPEFRPSGHEFRHKGYSRWPAVVVALLVIVSVLAGLAAAWYLWDRRNADLPRFTGPGSPAKETVQEPAITHVPVEPAQPLAAAQVREGLIALLGLEAVERLLQTRNFPQRFVATVDNLTRDAAPSAAWPVTPTPGRFTVDEGAGDPVAGRANAARYARFITLAESVDTERAVLLYRRMYPLLQQAYTDLGHGERHFNNRLVQVIDHLLAAPEPAQPPPLVLMQIRGTTPDPRPWVRWEFVDPQLQSSSAGHKIMVRMGLDNERRVKRKLREIRAALVRGVQAPGASPASGR